MPSPRTAGAHRTARTCNRRSLAARLTRHARARRSPSASLTRHARARLSPRRSFETADFDFFAKHFKLYVQFAELKQRM